jgi:tetratricopeptide (TPR) repeat protein
MSTYEQALEFAGLGRYCEALRALNASRGPSTLRQSSEVLRAELLQRIQPREHVRDLVEKLLRSKLPSDERSRCEIVLGRMDREAGDRQAAIDHFQRAVAIATEIEKSDPKLKAWSLVALVLAVADNSGPDATAPILADLRSTLNKCGSAQLWAQRR